MSSLFDTNRASLKKLFAAHEKDGSLKFTDLLKLCSSTRIFPDLLGSPELHKVIVEVVQDPNTASISQNLPYPQLEIFLRSVAAKAFPSKSQSEQECLLFMHLKNSCSLRYSVDFETMTEDKRINIKRNVPRLNIDSAKNPRQTPKTTRRISVKPNSTKNIKSSSFLFRNSPKKTVIDKKHKGHAYSIVTPRMHEDKSIVKSSPRPQYTERYPKKTLKTVGSFASSTNRGEKDNKLAKLAQIFWKFQQKENVESIEKSIKSKKFARFLAYMEKKMQTFQLQVRFSFKYWGLIAKRLKNI